MTDTIRSNPESSKTDPLQSCIAQMLAEAPSDTRKIIPTGKIEALAQSMWEWFQSTDDVSVRLRTAESVGADILGHFILEAVGPDRPFLVVEAEAAGHVGQLIQHLATRLAHTRSCRFKIAHIKDDEVVPERIKWSR